MTVAIILTALFLAALVVAIVVRVVWSKVRTGALPEAVLRQVSTWALASTLFAGCALIYAYPPEGSDFQRIVGDVSTQVTAARERVQERLTQTATTPAEPAATVTTPTETTPTVTATQTTETATETTPTEPPPAPEPKPKPKPKPQPRPDRDAQRCLAVDELNDAVPNYTLRPVAARDRTALRQQFRGARALDARLIVLSANGTTIGRIVALCPRGDTAAYAVEVRQALYRQLAASTGEGTVSTSLPIGSAVVNGHTTTGTSRYIGVWSGATGVYFVDSGFIEPLSSFLYEAVPQIDA